jgi:uncharacterized membrane protein
MTHGRLHALADGIFAIVMTLMVLELKLPSIQHASNKELWNALLAQKAIFASYFISSPFYLSIGGPTTLS